MKKPMIIIILCLFQMINLSSQVVTSGKASVKFNNKKKEEAVKPPAPDQTVNQPRSELIKAPEIELININIDQGKVLDWSENKINLIGKLSLNNQKAVLYLNNKEININESGFFNVDQSLVQGMNDISLKAVSESKLISEISFKVNYVPKVIEVVPGAEGNYYALLIGIDSYSDPAINPLERPIKDAEQFYNVITTRYTFKKQNIKLLRNATMAEIIDALDYFAKIVQPVDNFLIFYAGHGVWDAKSQIGFWLPSDAKKSSKLAWFRNSTLRDYLQEIKSKHTLLISDACFGGSIFKTRSAFTDANIAINKLYELPSRKAMTSGTLTEVPDQSVFLKYMIDRLQNNFEKYLSSEQLFGMFRMAVINNSKVIPQFGVIQDVGDEGGDFIFILNEQ
jgi:hypothetical protein